MTVYDGPTGRTHPAAANPPIAPDSGGPAPLATVASRPDADPCEVACDAMPACVCGDLTPSDEAWLHAHTARCGYCADMLHSYERVDATLDRLQEALLPATQPPAWRPQQERRHRAGYARLDSPIGPLLVAVTDLGVCEIGFAANDSEEAFRRRLLGRGLEPVPDQAAVDRVGPQLQEYFGGQRDRFDVPLDFSGISPFTRAVLTATASVPFGQLSTYRKIAEQIGQPRATRAVGNALGRNPIPVIIPCHRIVRSDATLGGYTGGLWIKERLLSLEGACPRRAVLI